jgi:hypothetical protein
MCRVPRYCNGLGRPSRRHLFGVVVDLVGGHVQKENPALCGPGFLVHSRSTDPTTLGGGSIGPMSNVAKLIYSAASPFRPRQYDFWLMLRMRAGPGVGCTASLDLRERIIFHIGGTWKVKARCSDVDGCRAARPHVPRHEGWRGPVILPTKGVCVWAGGEIGLWRTTNASEN